MVWTIIYPGDLNQECLYVFEETFAGEEVRVNKPRPVAVDRRVEARLSCAVPTSFEYTTSAPVKAASRLACDNENARRVETFAPSRAEPAMIPERMGIIGSTQGVNDSAKPKRSARGS